MEKNNNTIVKKIAYAGLLAALACVGYMVFPSFSVTGTKVHVGNAFVVIAALLLGGVYGGLSGAIGLTIADLLSGYAASAPRTFICKFLIGLICGLVAHKVFKINDQKTHGRIVTATVVASISGLFFNGFFEPALKWFWYTILTPNADKAASAIKSLLAVTVYTTWINAVINAVIAIVLYLALRPALLKIGVIVPSNISKPSKDESEEE